MEHSLSPWGAYSFAFDSIKDPEAANLPAGSEGLCYVVIQRGEKSKAVSVLNEVESHAKYEKIQENPAEIRDLIGRIENAELIGYVMQIEVSPTTRRSGIATALLDIAAWELKKRKINWEYGVVMDKNPLREKVLALLSKCSFKRFIRLPDGTHVPFGIPGCTLALRNADD